MLSPAPNRASAFHWNAALPKYVTALVVNISEPVMTADAKAAQVSGNVSRLMRVSERGESASPSSRRSTINHRPEQHDGGEHVRRLRDCIAGFVSRIHSASADP